MEIVGNFEKENKKVEKILKTLKKLKDHMEIHSTSMTVSPSAIGFNVMLNVKVIVKHEDFSEKTQVLHFDVTDYDSW